MLVYQVVVDILFECSHGIFGELSAFAAHRDEGCSRCTGTLPTKYPPLVVDRFPKEHTQFSTFFGLFQWIGLRENLHEIPVFNGKNDKSMVSG